MPKRLDERPANIDEIDALEDATDHSEPETEFLSKRLTRAEVVVCGDRQVRDKRNVLAKMYSQEPLVVNGHLKVYQFWESKSVPPDGVERFYAGMVDTISPPSLEYVLLKP